MTDPSPIPTLDELRAAYNDPHAGHDHENVDGIPYPHICLTCSTADAEVAYFRREPSSPDGESAQHHDGLAAVARLVAGRYLTARDAVQRQGYIDGRADATRVDAIPAFAAHATALVELYGEASADTDVRRSPAEQHAAGLRAVDHAAYQRGQHAGYAAARAAARLDATPAALDQLGEPDADPAGVLPDAAAFIAATGPVDTGCSLSDETQVRAQVDALLAPYRAALARLESDLADARDAGATQWSRLLTERDNEVTAHQSTRLELAVAKGELRDLRTRLAEAADDRKWYIGGYKRIEADLTTERAAHQETRDELERLREELRRLRGSLDGPDLDAEAVPQDAIDAAGRALGWMGDDGLGDMEDPAAEAAHAALRAVGWSPADRAELERLRGDVARLDHALSATIVREIDAQLADRLAALRTAGETPADGR